MDARMNRVWWSVFALAALGVAGPAVVTAERLRVAREPLRKGGVAASDVAGVVPPPPPPQDGDLPARKLLEQDLPSTRSLQQYGYGGGDYSISYSTSYGSLAPPSRKRSSVDDSTENFGFDDLDDVYALPPHPYGLYGGYAEATYSHYFQYADPPSAGGSTTGRADFGSDPPLPLLPPFTSFANASNFELEEAADIVADQLALVINGRKPSRQITAAVFIISQQLLSPTSLLPSPEVIISALVEALKTRIARGSDVTLHQNKSPVKTRFCFYITCISDIPVSVEAIASTL